jgi:TIR domain
MPANCPNCGTTLVGQPRFCPDCDTPLESQSGPEPVSVFYSYSHQDEDLRAELEAHLAALRRSGLIQEWHDRQILPGEDWDKEINKYLQSANLILFLISADFLSSSYISDVEVKRAIERQRAGDAVVIPIILRPVLWKVIPEFARLQALPDGARPVTEWPSHDAAFLSVSEGILAVLISRASSKADRLSSAESEPVFRRPLAHSRGRRRVLDAAVPAEVPVGRPSAVLVLVRKTDSPGLRLVVEAEPEYGITVEDVSSKPVVLKFPTDENGTPAPLDLSIRLESPQFQPQLQNKSITVPPRGDSEARIFFVIPVAAGPLLLNLEVRQAERILTGCVLKTIGTQPAPGLEPISTAQAVVSAALPVSDTDELESSDSATRVITPYSRESSGEPNDASPAQRKSAPTFRIPSSFPGRIEKPYSQQPINPPCAGTPSQGQSSDKQAPSPPKKGGVNFIPWAIWPVLMILAILIGMTLKHC